MDSFTAMLDQKVTQYANLLISPAAAPSNTQDKNSFEKQFKSVEDIADPKHREPFVTWGNFRDSLEQDREERLNLCSA
jgi:hypothetical protein